MTTAEQIDLWVNTQVNETRDAVSLTQIFAIKPPQALIALGYDEIAYVYPDGSRFVTSLTCDDEWTEFLILRERIAQ